METIFALAGFISYISLVGFLMTVFFAGTVIRGEATIGIASAVKIMLMLLTTLIAGLFLINMRI